VFASAGETLAATANPNAIAPKILLNDVMTLLLHDIDRGDAALFSVCRPRRRHVRSSRNDLIGLAQVSPILRNS
jgi:hypothetical protein